MNMGAPTTTDDFYPTLCEKDMQCELEVEGSTGWYPRQIIMREVQRVEFPVDTPKFSYEMLVQVESFGVTESWT